MMLLGWLFLWLGTVVGLLLTVRIVPGIRAHTGGALLLAAVILLLANSFVRPLLLLLTLPLTVLTFGLFILVINALMLMLTAALVPGFEVRGFGSALLGAVVMGLLTLLGLVLLGWLFPEHGMIVIQVMPPHGRDVPF